MVTVCGIHLAPIIHYLDFMHNKSERSGQNQFLNQTQLTTPNPIGYERLCVLGGEGKVRMHV